MLRGQVCSVQPSDAFSNAQWGSNEDEANIYLDLLCIISQASGYGGWTKKKTLKENN